jgi:hypothetical protein
VEECEDLSGAKGRGASPAGACGGRETARLRASGIFGRILRAFLVAIEMVVIDFDSTNAFRKGEGVHCALSREEGMIGLPFVI